MFARSGEITAPCGVPPRRDPLALLHHARVQPFLDQTDHPPVADPMLDEPDQPIVARWCRRTTGYRRQAPSSLASLIASASASSASMLAAPRPEPVAETQELRLVDRRQDPTTAAWTILSSRAAMPSGRCCHRLSGCTSAARAALDTLRDGPVRGDQRDCPRDSRRTASHVTPSTPGARVF